MPPRVSLELTILGRHCRIRINHETHACRRKVRPAARQMCQLAVLRIHSVVAVFTVRRLVLPTAGQLLRSVPACRRDLRSLAAHEKRRVPLRAAAGAPTYRLERGPMIGRRARHCPRRGRAPVPTTRDEPCGSRGAICPRAARGRLRQLSSGAFESKTRGGACMPRLRGACGAKNQQPERYLLAIGSASASDLPPLARFASRQRDPTCRTSEARQPGR